MIIIIIIRCKNMLFFQCFDFRKLIFPSDFASTKILYINQDSQNLILAKTLLFI